MGSRPGDWNMFSDSCYLLHQLRLRGVRYNPRLPVAIRIHIINDFAVGYNKETG